MSKKEKVPMTDFNVILAYVTLDATKNQLDALIESIRFRRDKLAKINKAKISVGLNVKFSHNGINYSGVVKTVKIKKAVVYSYDNRASYNVPLEILVAA